MGLQRLTVDKRGNIGIPGRYAPEDYLDRLAVLTLAGSWTCFPHYIILGPTGGAATHLLLGTVPNYHKWRNLTVSNLPSSPVQHQYIMHGHPAHPAGENWLDGG
jgi:hypothetical protein